MPPSWLLIYSYSYKAKRPTRILVQLFPDRVNTVFESAGSRWRKGCSGVDAGEPPTPHCWAGALSCSAAWTSARSPFSGLCSQLQGASLPKVVHPHPRGCLVNAEVQTASPWACIWDFSEGPPDPGLPVASTAAVLALNHSLSFSLPNVAFLNSFLTLLTCSQEQSSVNCLPAALRFSEPVSQGTGPGHTVRSKSGALVPSISPLASSPNIAVGALLTVPGLPGDVAHSGPVSCHSSLPPPTSATFQEPWVPALWPLLPVQLATK